MSDYKELISDLRDAEQANWKRLSLDAAKAIENLERQVESLKQENSFLKSMQREIAENMEPDSLGKMVVRAMRG